MVAGYPRINEKGINTLEIRKLLGNYFHFIDINFFILF